MNYEETKLTEALAICASDDCDGCPYYDFHQCYEQVKRGAHKLIIKQDRTIERLKDDYSKLQELFAQYQMASDKEIVAQKKEAEKRFENNMKSVLEIEKKQAKIDVLNELKEKRTTVFIDIDEVDEAVFIDDIDELIKEVKNER